ncbi:MAG: phosphodiester glycosidase family protein, partial [Vallitaleaceae bacterium]|nr:phosphodiester glycosidase family protein [Vallitaleaceae bacterium]
MKKLLLIVCTVVLLTLFLSGSFGSTPSSYTKTDEFTINGSKKTVKSVWTDLKDPTIRVEEVLANGRVGAVDSLKDIANSVDDADSTVLAAINGTFFNAYADLQPSGTLQVKGEMVHISNSGSVFGVDGDNQCVIQPLYVNIEGSINGSWVWPNNWGAWNINHVITNPSSIVIFTPDFGTKTSVHTMTSIVVDKNIVTQIVQGQATIPANGFVVVLGGPGEISKFKVGDTVEYKLSYFEDTNDSTNHTDTEISWENMRSSVGAGPTLLLDKEIVLDAEAEGFTEPKIIMNRAGRSFIGVTDQNVLVMGVVSNVNMAELAQITQLMGLKDAMNLDGGASSGLLFKNNYIQQPGRELSNALVIKQYTKRPLRVLLNEQELFFDVDPMIDTSNRTLVPMRKIFEALGATVSWNNATQMIVAQRDGTIIELKTNSNVAIVNGQEITLDSAVIVKENRSLVPVRFIT